MHLQGTSVLVREARVSFAAAGIALLSVVGVLTATGATGAIAAVTALGFLAVLLPALERGLADHPYAHFGGANRLTLARAVLTACLLGRAFDPLPIGERERWVLTAVAIAALVLDGIDGRLARTQGLASGFGARFDREVDAVTVFALAFLAWRAAAMPAWVLAIGGMRYLFAAGGLLLPRLSRIPAGGWANWRRKTIGVTQSTALIAAVMPAMPPAPARFACAAALMLLIYSFAADALSRDETRGLKE